MSLTTGGCEKYCMLRNYLELVGILSCKVYDTSVCCICRTKEEAEKDLKSLFVLGLCA